MKGKAKKELFISVVELHIFAPMLLFSFNLPSHSFHIASLSLASTIAVVVDMVYIAGHIVVVIHKKALFIY